MGCVSGSVLKHIESPTLGKLYSIFNSSIRLLKLIAIKQNTLVRMISLMSPKLPPILPLSLTAYEAYAHVNQLHESVGTVWNSLPPPVLI